MISSYKYVCAANGIDAIYSNDLPWPGDQIESDGKTKRVTKSVATPIQPGWYKVELFFNEGKMTDTTIQPHQQRVLDEYKELTERRDKLAAFTFTPLFRSLEEAERQRLDEQLVHMNGYQRVLAARIHAMGLSHKIL